MSRDHKHATAAHEEVPAAGPAAATWPARAAAILLAALLLPYETSAGGPTFDTAGELRWVSPVTLPAAAADGAARDFVENVRVDDDLNPEHREPAAVWGPHGVLCAAYAERATHYNPELIMFTRSGDGGLTWLPRAIRVNDTQPNAVVFPALDILPDGRLLLVWAEMKFAPYNYEIRFAYSTDGGETWSPSSVIHPLDPTTDYFRPAMLVVENRVLVAYWEETTYPDGQPLLVYSDDGGDSWCDPVTITTMPCDCGGSAPCLAYDASLGMLGVVVPTHQERIYFLYSTDLGDSWSLPIQINDAVASSANYPDLAAVDGCFYAVWNDNRLSDADIWLAFSEDGVTWSHNLRVNDDLISGNQYEPHLRCDADGGLHACWIWNLPFQSNIDLYYSMSLDGGQSWLPQAQRVNDIPYVVQPYVAWSADLLTDDRGGVYLWWNDGRDTDYYDNIYFSRQLDPSAVIPQLPTALEQDGAIVQCRWRGHPGPEPVLIFVLDRDARVSCGLFDLNGRRCGAEIVRTWGRGEQRLEWSAFGAGRVLSTGTYVTRLHVAGQSQLLPVLIIR